MYNLKSKVYYCNKCKTTLDKKPTRLLIQKYGLSGRDRFDNYKHIDLCSRCYKSFIGWYKGVQKVL